MLNLLAGYIGGHLRSENFFSQSAMVSCSSRRLTVSLSPARRAMVRSISRRASEPSRPARRLFPSRFFRSFFAAGTDGLEARLEFGKFRAPARLRRGGEIGGQLFGEVPAHVQHRVLQGQNGLVQSKRGLTGWQAGSCNRRGRQRVPDEPRSTVAWVCAAERSGPEGLHRTVGADQDIPLPARRMWTHLWPRQ